ncbi:MAG: hypothetical protein Tsb009_11110 [Planctomycetaceae bacterium]
MNYTDYIQGIQFRFLPPNKKRPKGVRLLSRLLAKIGWHFEVANTVLPDDQQEMRERLKHVCKLPRMSTFAVGAIINRAVSEMSPGHQFVNVGVWHGFTFFSGLAGNSEKPCIGVDNFSHRDSPRDQFLSRMTRWRSTAHRFHEMDFRDYFQHAHSGPIGVYVFDGPHTRQDHLDALEFAEPFFADNCIVIIDDSNWDQVRSATDQFLARSSHHYEKLFDVRTPASGHPTFWNGLMIFRRADLKTGKPASTTQSTVPDIVSV